MRGKNRIRQLACALIVSSLLAATAALADDHTPVPDGYKKVNLPGGSTVLVKKQSGDDRTIPTTSSTPDKYDPSQIINKASPLGSKAFHFDSGYTDQNKSLSESLTKSYPTKSYFSAKDKSGTKSPFATGYTTSANQEFNRAAPDAVRAYPVSSHDASDLTKKAFPVKASAEQDRSSGLSDKKYATFASPYSNKTAPQIAERFDGQGKDDFIRLKELPDHPLTVDEVRALINHGVRPSAKDDEADGDKPLSDAAVRENRPSKADKEESRDNSDSNLVPDPGTFSQPGTIPDTPEKTEPLPQRQE